MLVKDVEFKKTSENVAKEIAEKVSKSDKNKNGIFIGFSIFLSFQMLIVLKGILSGEMRNGIVILILFELFLFGMVVVFVSLIVSNKIQGTVDFRSIEIKEAVISHVKVTWHSGNDIADPGYDTYEYEVTDTNGIPIALNETDKYFSSIISEKLYLKENTPVIIIKILYTKSKEFKYGLVDKEYIKSLNL